MSRIAQTKKYGSTFSRKKQRKSKIYMIVRFCVVFLSLSRPACSILTPFLRTVQNLMIYINVRVQVRARHVTEISGAHVQCTKICDLCLRSKARSVRHGQKRSRLHISALLTCCIDVVWGEGGGAEPIPSTLPYPVRFASIYCEIEELWCQPWPRSLCISADGRQ